MTESSYSSGRKATRHAVWEYFSKSENEKALCLLCKNEIFGFSANMLTHLRAAHKAEHASVLETVKKMSEEKAKEKMTDTLTECTTL